ncbi:unnamed protein product, partial [Ixodes hexagonus]
FVFESIGHYCNCQRFVILLGDFNCVCSTSDKSSSIPFADASTVCLNEIINNYGLEDVGECVCEGRGVVFTHFQGSSHARLDRAYVPFELVPLCHDYQVCPVSFSDHCLVKFCIRKRNKIRKVFRWELWKLNAKLLGDQLFISQVQAAVERMEKGDKTERYGSRWEVFKQEVKMIALERATEINNERRKNEALMRSNLQMLLKEECRAPGVFKDAISSLKERLELLDRDRYRGALVRARADRLIKGEVPTKRALGTEKRYARRNEIAEIERDGSVTCDSAEIE